jgi:hypothetical protein
MSFFTTPLVTYGEFGLEMPASASLWSAPSAEAWKEVYFRQMNATSSRLPSAIGCMKDVQVPVDSSNRLDNRFCRHIMLSTFWRQIWNCRELAVSTKRPGSVGLGPGMVLAATHWQQDMSQTIGHFRMNVSDVEPFSAPAALICEHLLLNVYVSFDELSRFSGKEGIQEARRALPNLQRWAQGQSARKAVWHAGQIIREANGFPQGTLRDFPAVALYHAGLTLWAFGLLSGEGTHASRPPNHRTPSFSNTIPDTGGPGVDNSVAILNGEESIATQKFIGIGRALPAIQQSENDWYMTEGSQIGQARLVFLSRPASVMQTVIRILQGNHEHASGRSIPLLVENLIRLMYDLSYAVSRKDSEGN